MPLTPQVITRAELAYLALYQKATFTEKLNGDGNRDIIYTGSIIETMNSVGINSPAWNKIRKLLISAGCISVLQRGDRSQPTSILLIEPPTEEALENAAQGLTSPTGAAKVSALDERVQRLEAWREVMANVNVAETLRDFEKRISKLESNK